MTDLMSRARFRTAFGSLGSREAVFVLRHAWLNPQAKHMTTGSVEACTITALDAIAAFAVPNPNHSSQS